MGRCDKLADPSGELVGAATMYRMKGLLTLAELLAQMGPEIAERTTAWLREALEPGETMPDVALLLKLVERRLRRLRERLREKDGRLSRALTALTVARRLRDQAAEKMRGVLIAGRDLLGGCTRESVAWTSRYAVTGVRRPALVAAIGRNGGSWRRCAASITAPEGWNGFRRAKIRSSEPLEP